MPTFDGILETGLEYFLGTDKTYDFVTYTSSDKTTVRDVTGYTMNFMVKLKQNDADVDAVLSLAGAVSGVFDADPAVNEQKTTVIINDESTDTEIAPEIEPPSLKVATS